MHINSKTGRQAAIVCAMVLFLAFCGSERKTTTQSQPKRTDSQDLSVRTGAVLHEQRVLRPAIAAANDVVRNTGDCEALQKALPEARRQIDEAEKRVGTSTGRETIAALRTRIQNAADLCP